MSVAVSIEFSSSFTGTLFSHLSFFFCLNGPPFFPVFFYIIYLSLFSSQCGGPGCRGLLASRYKFVLERIVILKTQFFLLMLKNKNDRVSSPPIIRLYIFAAIFLCLLCLSSFLLFSFSITSYRFVICISLFNHLSFCSPKIFSCFQKSYYNFSLLFLKLSHHNSIHKHTKKIQKLLKLLQFIFVVYFSILNS